MQFYPPNLPSELGFRRFPASIAEPAETPIEPEPGSAHVRFWHKADMPRSAGQCPLSGGNRT